MKTRILLLTAILALFLVGCVRGIPPPDMDAAGTTELGYSYQGPIDPAAFESWTEIYSEPLMTPFGIFMDMYFQNPDPEAQIQFANVIVTAQGIAGYYLFYGGQFYAYYLEPNTGCYERQEIDAEVLEMLKQDFQNAFDLRLN